MKKLLGVVVLGLLLCNTSFAEKFNYSCVLNYKYQNSDKDSWLEKDVEFIIDSVDGKNVRMFDKEINHYYFPLKININNYKILVAHQIFKKKDWEMVTTLIINKQTGYTKYSEMWYDNEGGVTFSTGKCD